VANTTVPNQGREVANTNLPNQISSTPAFHYRLS
jgi:hypothetical protein